MPKPRLLVVGPLPPPVHGVSVSTSLVLDNRRLLEAFDVEHVDTSDPRPLAQVGTWDARNVVVGLRNVADLARRLRGARGVVYLPLSQGTGGFLRDSLLVHLARTRGWRVAAHLRGGELLDFYTRLPAPLRTWARATLSSVDAIAVMSERLRWLVWGFVSAGRVAVVPNGTPDEFGEDGAHRPPRVLYLGNLIERKGVAAAVDAAALVLDRRPDVSFVFAGDWYEEAFRYRVVSRAAPFGDRIRFVPRATGEDRLRLYRSAGVFLFAPIEPEGHPRVVLEAMAAGLPVVTTDRGGIADTVVHGETGFVLPHPDPHALARHLLRLLDDENLRRGMATAARARYLERFTQDEADRVLADWLRSVAA